MQFTVIVNGKDTYDAMEAARRATIFDRFGINTYEEAKEFYQYLKLTLTRPVTKFSYFNKTLVLFGKVWT